MKLVFVTTNKGKFLQAKELFDQHNIELEHLSMEYPEDSDSDIPTVAKDGAKLCAERLQKPVMVDDTGIFFDAYPGFPGPQSGFVYRGLGFEGLFRLLEGKPRTAYFSAACAYCEPNKDPVVFEGIMKGKIIEKQPEDDKTPLPYEVVFIPEGHNKLLRDFSPKERFENLNHHRTKAFLQLINHLKLSQL